MDTIAGVLSSGAYDSSVINKTADALSSGASFSELLSDMLQDELSSKTAQIAAMPSGVMSSGSLSSGYGLDSSSQMLENLIMGAASSGEISDAKTAMFMLCMMMMQSGGSELSQFLPMMAAMLSGLQGDTAQLQNEVLNSNYPVDVLSTIDSQVFSNSTPSLSASGAVVPEQAWKPVTPAVISTAFDRSPQKLREVIDQFDVENSVRYRPYRNGSDTYCNIYLWDVTSALDCEIPHFVDLSTGQPRQYPDISGANELDAEGVEWWLVNYGGQYGWREVDSQTAQEYANRGMAAVTTAGDIGHVQIVCPSENGAYDPIRGVTIAQSGSKNISYTHISSIYSAGSMSKVRYFVHS